MSISKREAILHRRVRKLRAALAIVTRDRDTLLTMTGTTIEQVVARLRAQSAGSGALGV